MVYLVWKFSGADPYRVFNQLDEDYRPIGGGESRPPLNPARLRYFLYGMAEAAFEEEIELAGAKVRSQRGGV